MIVISLARLQINSKVLENPPLSEFNEFELRLKSAENRFKPSAGLNLKELITIQSGNNHI